jgi:branched-chain amino acid aminotransferase
MDMTLASSAHSREALDGDLHAATASEFASGAAYFDGRFMPIGQAGIPITDWGYRRADTAYDVVTVRNGSFFRLDDHLKRFRASMNSMRLSPPEDNERIGEILHECVRLSGLRDAYVAMDCLRGRPRPNQVYHPINCRNYLVAFAIPFVWLMQEDVRKRGVHLIVASVPRIPESSVNQRAKNFNWGDLNQGLFEAHDRGADNCMLLTSDGFVTEGPGFNVFVVSNGRLATPDRNILEGITRLSMLDLCVEMMLECEVRPVSSEELRDADEVFITTSAGGVIAVTRVDGRIIGNDKEGAITARLREHYWTKRNDGWHGTPVDYNGSPDVSIG